MKDILVTGVAVIDFIFELDEIPTSPEKYRTHKGSISGGGVAANAAVAISRLGGNPYIATRLGDDHIASIIKKDFIDENVKIDYVKIFNNTHSSYSSVFIDKNGERQVVNFRDKKIPEDASWLKHIPKKDAYLADSRWESGAIETLKLAKKFNKPGILDAEETVTQKLIECSSHIAFSSSGLKMFTQISQLEKALKKVSKITKKWICVTDGPNGVYYLENSMIKNIPSKKILAKETLGAGDIWHGAFTLSLAEGENEIESIKFANSVAAYKCQFTGGRKGYPFKNQLEIFMNIKKKV